MLAALGSWLSALSCPLASCASPGVLTRKTLPNGLEIIAAPVAGARLASLDVWVRAGSAAERPEERAAAHFLEHMLFKGTPTRGPGQIDAAVETCGGMLNAGTLRDAAHVFVTVEPRYLREVIEIMADAIRRPSLDAAEFELERTVILDEFARNLHEAGKASHNAAFAAAYRGHPYSLPVLGTPDAVRALQRDAVAAFHARRYIPSNCVVVIAGDVQPAAAIEAASSAFGTWASETPSGLSAPGEPAGQTRPLEPAHAGPLTVTTLGAASSSVVRAWRTPPSTLLAEAATSLVVAELLDNALAARSGAGEDAGAEVVPGLDGGLLVAWHPAKDQEASIRLRTHVDRLIASGPSAGELEGAIRQILGRHLYLAETTPGLARQIGLWAVLGDPAFPVELEARLRKVGQPEVKAFALHWLAAERADGLAPGRDTAAAGAP